VLVCAWLSPAANGQSRPDVDPRVEKLLNDISEDRLRTLLTRLVSFGTRNTLSDTSSPTRGIGAAREWILDELKRSSPRLQVSFDSFVLPPQGRLTRQADVRNVIAVLPGRSGRRIYVSGHYDSQNAGPQESLITRPSTAPALSDPQLDPAFDHNRDAPGANDNGSGTVLTMELARVFAQSEIDFEATLVFALWAGEEQGILGSTAHARKIEESKVIVDAMLNNDIVGNARGGNGVVNATAVRVYSDGPEDSAGRNLARYIGRTAATYVPGQRVRLLAREDRFNRGSDHTSFTRSGFPAVVFREAAEDLSRQHSPADTVDGVDIAYLARNARINAAATASLALSPPAPTVSGDRGQRLLSRDPSGYDASLRWQPAPGAVSYRVYWREAWTLDWQNTQNVGNVTHFVLPGLSIDDYVFGVAAIGPSGAESLVSTYRPAAVTVPPLKPSGSQ
jgi:hypothetical protein